MAKFHTYEECQPLPSLQIFLEKNQLITSDHMNTA